MLSVPDKCNARVRLALQKHDRQQCRCYCNKVCKQWMQGVRIIEASSVLLSTDLEDEGGT